MEKNPNSTSRHKKKQWKLASVSGFTVYKMMLYLMWVSEPIWALKWGLVLFFSFSWDDVGKVYACQTVEEWNDV